MKTALVTGSSDGIGRQSAGTLAAAGWRVFVHARHEARGADALARLRASWPDGAFDLVTGDLASLAAVRGLAEQVRTKTSALDALVLNAAVMPRVRTVTADGFEANFGVNHLAHVVLALDLLPLLRAAPAARIVAVSSVAHRRGRLHLDDLSMTRAWDAYGAYAQSKLANLLFALALARRLEGTTVASHGVHPGVITTKLLTQGFGVTGGSLEEGARSTVAAVTSPALRERNGVYLGPDGEETPSDAARDEALQETLWDESLRLTGAVFSAR